MSTITAAHQALERAEQKIRDAERARDEARDQLDQALAAKGWRRLRSVQADVYEDMRSGMARDLPTVLAVEQQAAA